MITPDFAVRLKPPLKRVFFEFAPMLTIRNRWERANIPTFVPMGEEIVIPIDHFEPAEPFNIEFEPEGQEDEMRMELSFEPLE